MCLEGRWRVSGATGDRELGVSGNSTLSLGRGGASLEHSGPVGLGNHCRGLSAHGEHQVKSHDVRHLGGQQRDFDPEKA